MQEHVLSLILILVLDLLIIEQNIRNIEKLSVHAVLRREHFEIRVFGLDQPVEHRVALGDFAAVNGS